MNRISLLSTVVVAGAICAGFTASAFAQTPPFNGGGSGFAFDPEISIVHSGALLDAQVVVSEDRRYVTITARPSVSRLQSLDVFPAVGFTGGGVSGGGGAGGAAGGARLGFVGGAGYIDETANALPAEVKAPAQSKEAAERAAHASKPAPIPSNPTSSSPSEILKTDPTAANSVLRKEGMFLLASAK